MGGAVGEDTAVLTLPEVYFLLLPTLLHFYNERTVISPEIKAKGRTLNSEGNIF